MLGDTKLLPGAQRRQEVFTPTDADDTTLDADTLDADTLDDADDGDEHADNIMLCCAGQMFLVSVLCLGQVWENKINEIAKRFGPGTRGLEFGVRFGIRV